jgi:hypothetical protein
MAIGYPTPSASRHRPLTGIAARPAAGSLQGVLVPLTIIAFFAGMIGLGLVVIVVETWWVVALVGITHMTASIVLGWLVWKGLADEPDSDPEPLAGP